MRVRVSRRAEIDLIEITDFIALGDPERANQFEDELRERAQKISLTPLGYAERPEFREGLRSCAHGAYVIFFTADEQACALNASCMGHGTWESLLNQ